MQIHLMMISPMPMPQRPSSPFLKKSAIPARFFFDWNDNKIVTLFCDEKHSAFRKNYISAVCSPSLRASCSWFGFRPSSLSMGVQPEMNTMMVTMVEIMMMVTMVGVVIVMMLFDKSEG